MSENAAPGVVTTASRVMSAKGAMPLKRHTSLTTET